MRGLANGQNKIVATSISDAIDLYSVSGVPMNHLDMSDILDFDIFSESLSLQEQLNILGSINNFHKNSRPKLGSTGYTSQESAEHSARSIRFSFINKPMEGDQPNSEERKYPNSPRNLIIYMRDSLSYAQNRRDKQRLDVIHRLIYDLVEPRLSHDHYINHPPAKRHKRNTQPNVPCDQVDDFNMSEPFSDVNVAFAQDVLERGALYLRSMAPYIFLLPDARFDNNNRLIMTPGCFVHTTITSSGLICSCKFFRASDENSCLHTKFISLHILPLINSDVSDTQFGQLLTIAKKSLDRPILLASPTDSQTTLKYSIIPNSDSEEKTPAFIHITKLGSIYCSKDSCKAKYNFKSNVKKKSRANTTDACPHLVVAQGDSEFVQRLQERKDVCSVVCEDMEDEGIMSKVC